MTRFFAVLFACLAAGCASAPEPRNVEALLNRSIAAANGHIARQEPIEAMQFLDVVAAIDNEYPGLQEAYGRARASTPAELAGLFRPSPMGVNRPPRYPVERTTGKKVLLYIPDRLVDLLDCITFDLHLGPGFYFNGHATRAVQAGGGARAIFGVGTYGARSILGSRVHSTAGVSVLMVGAEAQAGALASAAGFRTVSDAHAGVYRPTDPFFQSFADYWEVGFSYTLGVGGFGMDVHPIQLVDALGGFALWDPARDDWATSRALSIDRRESKLVRRLVAVGGSTEARTAYTEWIRAERAAGRAPVHEASSGTEELD